MTKHEKEKQRYYVKWLLVSLIVINVLSGIVGAFIGIKHSDIILIMLGELITLLGVFFGFNMSTAVKDDEITLKGE